MRKVICLFCKLKISLNLITCALIDHNACAIYIGVIHKLHLHQRGKVVHECQFYLIKPIKSICQPGGSGGRKRQIVC